MEHTWVWLTPLLLYVLIFERIDYPKGGRR